MTLKLTKEEKQRIKEVEHELQELKVNKAIVHIIGIDIEELQDQLKYAWTTEEKKKDIRNEIKKFSKRKQEIAARVNKLDAAINNLSDLEKTIIELRYIQELKLKDIGEKIYFTVNYISNYLKPKLLIKIAQQL